MEYKTFKMFFCEQQLRPGYIFKSLDKSGDLAGKTMTVLNVSGNEVTFAFDDGTQITAKIADLNVDPKSIKKK